MNALAIRAGQVLQIELGTRAVELDLGYRADALDRSCGIVITRGKKQARSEHEPGEPPGCHKHRLPPPPIYNGNVAPCDARHLNQVRREIVPSSGARVRARRVRVWRSALLSGARMLGRAF